MDLFDKVFHVVEKHFSPPQYPCLQEQLQRFKVQKPFVGQQVLYAAPLARNTLVSLLPIIAGGAELAVSWPKITTPDPEVVAFLLRCRVVCHYKVPYTLSFDVILDCSGDHAKVKSARGYVELTRSGLAYYKDLKGKTCIDVDSSLTKNLETTLGTGDGLLRALEQSGHKELQDKRVLLFGLGKVGRGINRAMQSKGAQVSVVERIEQPKNCTNMTKWTMADDKEQVLSAVGDADFVITATGVKNVIQNNYPIQPFLESKAILLNMGAEDEFGPGFPSESVGNHKTAFNFILDEPTQIEFIDPVLALYNECAALLLSEYWNEGIQKVPEALDQSMVDRFCREQGYSRDDFMM